MEIPQYDIFHDTPWYPILFSSAMELRNHWTNFKTRSWTQQAPSGQTCSIRMQLLSLRMLSYSWVVLHTITQELLGPDSTLRLYLRSQRRMIKRLLYSVREDHKGLRRKLWQNLLAMELCPKATLRSKQPLLFLEKGVPWKIQQEKLHMPKPRVHNIKNVSLFILCTLAKTQVQW